MGNAKTVPSSTQDYSYLELLLDSTSSFKKKHKKLTYPEFDYFIARELSLFVVGLGFDSIKLNEVIQELKKVLPSIKTIFAKPIIVLKNSPDVLPVELISKIGNDSLTNLGNHVNQVDNIKHGRIIPKKLLTEIYEDDYAIYENVLFCNFIDIIMKYCRVNMAILKSMLYESEIMEFNLLEKMNHIDYFLALGKLHTGYIRNFNKNLIELTMMYNELKDIMSAISARLYKPVYKFNKKRNKRVKLKKTNIFIMQKDYHKVYLAYRYFMNNSLIDDDDDEDIDFDNLLVNYRRYVNMLSVFGLGNFNFAIHSTSHIDVDCLNTTFKFKKWSLKMRTIENKALLLTMHKDKNYSILLYPSIDSDVTRYNCPLKKMPKFDEFIVCSPFEDQMVAEKASYLSPESIDSFRRVQQMILRAMIYCDNAHKDCPFCGGKLTFKNRAYICKDCHTEIRRATCPKTKKRYYYTSITDFIMPDLTSENGGVYQKDIIDRKLEVAYYFRNITKLDLKGNVICPQCGKVHLKKYK